MEVMAMMKDLEVVARLTCEIVFLLMGIEHYRTALKMRIN